MNAQEYFEWERIDNMWRQCDYTDINSFWDALRWMKGCGVNEYWRKYVFEKSLSRHFWNLAYQTYLLSEAWNKKRAHTIWRAKGICEICKRSEAVQAHHLTYDRLGDESPGDLQALCIDCHRAEHES